MLHDNLELESSHFEYVLPEELGGGSLHEADYQVSPGTEALIRKMSGELVDAKLQASGIVKLVCAEYVTPGDMAILEELTLNPDTDLLRTMSDTDDLLHDQYDLNEALRIFRPVATLLEAKLDVSIELTEKERSTLQTFHAFSAIAHTVDTELAKGYRAEEESPVSYVVPEGSYVIDYDDKKSVALSPRRVSASISRPMAPVYTLDGEISNEAIDDSVVEAHGNKTKGSFDRVLAFVNGETDRADMYDVSLVDTLLGEEALVSLSMQSRLGRIAAVAAGYRERLEAWGGSQTVFKVDWVQVVRGGLVSPK